jgi:integrase
MVASTCCKLGSSRLSSGWLGEALSLEWAQVKLEPAQGAKFGYLTVSSGKAKSKKSRNVSLSKRSVAMLRNRGSAAKGYVDFVLNSLRHTFGTRLGESGADAFTIMRLMGLSTVTVSQRCVHPSPEAVDWRMSAQIPPQLPGGDVALAS